MLPIPLPDFIPSAIIFMACGRLTIQITIFTAIGAKKTGPKRPVLQSFNRFHTITSTITHPISASD